MPKTNNLTGLRFGKLLVIEKTGFQEDRYYTWRCRCDCGKEIIVNTKRLVRGTITNCGCVPKGNAQNGPIAEDLTNQVFGKLVVLKRMPNQNDRRKWLCQCNCGNTCIVSAHELKAGKTQSCGCHRTYVLRERKTDLSGKKFGRLTPLYSTEKRDKKGSVYWHCKCDCGTELDVTEDCLVHGNYVSCGCRKYEIQLALPEQLTFVDGTCVEWLKYRKHRCDNSSGCAGVSETKSGKWKAYIGLQGKRYYLGTYSNKSSAISARKNAEESLHQVFLDTYSEWVEKANTAPDWAEKNPFYFRVSYENHEFQISTPMMIPSATP